MIGTQFSRGLRKKQFQLATHLSSPGSEVNAKNNRLQERFFRAVVRMVFRQRREMDSFISNEKVMAGKDGGKLFQEHLKN